MGYSTVEVSEIEPAGPGGMVRFVRRVLGAEAFGINWFELPPEARGFDHDETDSGQEEVYVVIAGSGHWSVGETQIPVQAGSIVRIDPETPRHPVAGPEGLTFVAVGARRGAYEPHGPF